MNDPPSTESARPPVQSWQRFTLLDALLLQAGVALGLSLAGWVVPAQAGTVQALSSGLRLFVGGATGVVLGGPLVLAVQFLFRGRTAPLSAGESDWLSAATIPASLFAVVLLRTWQWDWALGVAYLSGFAVLAILVLFVAVDAIRRWNGVRRPVPCKWTDAFGRWLVLALGSPSLLLLVYVLVSL